MFGGDRSAVRKPFHRAFAAIRKKKNGTVHEWRPPPVRKTVYTYFALDRRKIIFPHRRLLLAVRRRLGFVCSCSQLWTEWYFQDVIYCSLWTATMKICCLTQFISFAFSRKTAVDLIFLYLAGIYISSFGAWHVSSHNFSSLSLDWLSN